MSEVTMPRLSDTMEEGELARWLKNVGDTVEKGDVIAEIETDKATMDLEAFESGVLEKQLVEEGTVVPIGQAVAIIGDGSSGGAEPSGDEPAEAAAAEKDTAPEKDTAAEKNTVAAEAESSGELEDEDLEESEEPGQPAEAAQPEETADAPEPVEARESAEPREAASGADKLRMSPLARKLAHTQAYAFPDIDN